MSGIKVRINGRGNAWPVVLGQDHRFYDRSKLEDLANASFSIIKSPGKEPKENQIDWDLMIDCGHGSVQYLLKNCNRIPEAVFITHPHIDHTLGLDWIVQSYYKTYKKPYPVYTTILSWVFVKSTFPQLEGMINFKELMPFQKRKVDEVEDVEVTPFPVNHGKSAIGASMLLFTVNEKSGQKKVLFTGDILCPLLREEDYDQLNHVDMLVADANNRFPYPKSNHWSILETGNGIPSEYLDDFKQNCSLGLLLNPHINDRSSDNYSRCFDYFFNRNLPITSFYFSIEKFVERINPGKVVLIHYSGGEDFKYYGKPILNTLELETWVNNYFIGHQSKINFLVPYVSQHMDF